MADCLALALARQSVTTRRPSGVTGAASTMQVHEIVETTEMPMTQTDETIIMSTPIIVPPIAPGIPDVEENNRTFVPPTVEPNGASGEGDENGETVTQKEVEHENEQNERQGPIFPAGGFTTQRLVCSDGNPIE